MSERRYDEAEIRAIFARAAREQEEVQRRLGSDDGLTLAELTQIGEESGLSAAFVARAASSLGRMGSAPPPTHAFGLPVGVSRTVRLDAPLTDDEWEVLASDLRYTFDAKGKERSNGNVREWRNGNLYAIAERSDGGYRLRMGTKKGEAQTNLMLGVGFALVGLVLLVAIGLGVSLWSIIFPAFAFGISGLGLLASTWLSLPRWAAKRERQMEGVAERLLERTSGPPQMPLLDSEGAEVFEQDASAARRSVRS